MSIVLPGTDEPETSPFWQATREGRLVVQKLADGSLCFPPRHAQPGSSWQEVSGRGTVWSWVMIHGPTLPAYADAVPFPVAIVALEEGGMRMVGNLLKAPGAPLNGLSDQDIRIGQPVQVSFEQVADDVTLPCWVLAA